MSEIRLPLSDNPEVKALEFFLRSVRQILDYAPTSEKQFGVIQAMKQLDEKGLLKAIITIRSLKEVAVGLYSWLDLAERLHAGHVMPPSVSAASSAAQQASNQANVQKAGAAPIQANVQKAGAAHLVQTRIARLSEFSRAVAEAVRRVSVKVEEQADVALLSKVSPLMDRHAKVLLSTLGLSQYSTLRELTPEMVLLADPRDTQTQNFLALFAGAISRMLMSETLLTGVRQIPNMNYAAISAEISVFIGRLEEYSFVRIGEFEENRFSK